MCTGGCEIGASCVTDALLRTVLNMTIEIRDAVPEDWRAVGHLLEREFGIMRNELAAAKAAAQGLSSNSALLVATSGGLIAGVAFARPRWLNVPHAWSYEMLIVHPKSRRNGVGFNLTEEIEAAACAREVEMLIGVCNEQVLPFHYKCGFTSVDMGSPILLSDGGSAMVAATCDTDQHFIFKQLTASTADPSAICNTAHVRLASAAGMGGMLRADRELIDLR